MNICLDLFLTFARIGAFTFGGGYAMLPLIDHEVVEKKGWITEDELTEMTVIAESTPGPIAINCANFTFGQTMTTYTGQNTAGLKGAVAATVGMVLPSFLIILLISYFLENLLSYPAVEHAFRGIRIAVALVITRAALKMIQKMLKKAENRRMSIIFAVVFFIVVLSMNAFGVSFSTIYLILIAGLAGISIDAISRKGSGGT